MNSTKKTNRTVYKVVCRKFSLYPNRVYPTRTFYSARAGSDTHLVYTLGEKTVPKFGEIFCFTSLEDAKKFHWCGMEVILEGTCENPRKISYVSFLSKDIIRFWRLKKWKKSVKLISSSAPKGSIVVDSFTPEKIVTNGVINNV